MVPSGWCWRLVGLRGARWTASSREVAVAKAQRKLKGPQPKLSPKQQRELKRMHDTGEYTITDLGELFSVSRPTVYRTIDRAVAT